MADRSKLIFVNTDTDYEETAVADSLKFTSYKTATYELTDVLLGQLTNDVILKQGTRAFTGDQSMGGNKLTNLANGTAALDAVNYGQLTAAINGLDWKASARAATTAALPAVTYANGASGVGATLTANANGAFPAQDGVTLVVGNRILIKDQVADLQNGIYTLTDAGGVGTPFILTRATDNDSVPAISSMNVVGIEEGTLNADYAYKLTAADPITVGTTSLPWVSFSVNTFIGGAGIAISGNDISVDLYPTNPGLTFIGVGDAGQLTLDWATSPWNMAKPVKSSDLSSTSAGFGASIIGVDTTELGPYTAATNVEAALLDLFQASGDVKFTVGASTVNKGDLVYLTANNTVQKMPITALHRPIGMATSTGTTGQLISVQGQDYLLTGVLSGATFDAEYFWTGSAISATAPTTAGSYVWKLGVATNATDLWATMSFVKKNS